MVIENFFIHYHIPSQFLYAGDKRVDMYNEPDARKKHSRRKFKTVENISFPDINTDRFLEIARDLTKIDTGLILNSSQFIFNIFEFEKIPWQEGMRRELVEWRLKKVFPENLNDYWHQYYNLNKKRILSILFKKNSRERIEELFSTHNINLTYLGNSTVEIINHLAHLKKKSPDFFIEVDGSLVMIVFLDCGIPFYIRKFRVDQPDEIASEAIKTTNYVKNNYNKLPRLYSLIADTTTTDFHLIRDELAKHDITPWQTAEISKENEKFIFPG